MLIIFIINAIIINKIQSNHILFTKKIYSKDSGNNKMLAILNKTWLKIYWKTLKDFQSYQCSLNG